MDKLVIEGEKRLRGVISIGGSKNAVLPMMTATLLADGKYRFKNVPMLRDVHTMAKLLEGIGVKTRLDSHVLEIETGTLQHFEAPYELVKTMRASIYVLGPLLGRFGKAKVSLPGGCAWGPRPVDLHIEGMRKLGAQIEVEQGYIIAKAKRLKGARIIFEKTSVGATGNLLLASVLAKGTTVIENAALEPEITALARFLVKMGAKIEGIGTPRLEIEGVDQLHAVNERIIPDRIETGTYLVAGHITGSSLRLENADPTLVVAVIDKLKESGAHIEEGKNWISISSGGKVKPTDVVTSPYPGFPTDMQAQWIALMSIASGTSLVTETVFYDRFTHVPELQRLGANLTVDHNVCIVRGVNHLSGTRVMSTDLRASASLVLAGLVARGVTEISRIYHLDRGYEAIEVKLQQVGAHIRREKDTLEMG